jgi:hypothetical protein
MAGPEHGYSQIYLTQIEMTSHQQQGYLPLTNLIPDINIKTNLTIRSIPAS